MSTFEEPSFLLLHILKKIKAATTELSAASNLVKFKNGLLAELELRLTEEEWDDDYVRWYIHHCIEVRLNSASFFYRDRQDYAGDQQVALAGIAFAKLTNMPELVQELEEINQYVHSQLQDLLVA